MTVEAHRRVHIPVMVGRVVVGVGVIAAFRREVDGVRLGGSIPKVFSSVG